MTAFFLTLSPSLSKTLSLSCLFSKALSKLKADSFRCPFYLLLFYCSLFVLFFFWLFSLCLLLIKAFACCHFTCLSLPLSLALFLLLSCSLSAALALFLLSNVAMEHIEPESTENAIYFNHNSIEFRKGLCKPLLNLWHAS